MNLQLSANRKFLIAIAIGVILGGVSLVFWLIDQSISIGLLVVAMAIPIVTYLMHEDQIDMEDLFDKQEMAREEEHVPAVAIPEAPLNQLPIETIEGIGASYGKLLRAAGISTVEDLMKASPEKVKEASGVTTKQADKWIAMGRFALLDSVSEEDAEAIVIATGIRDLKKLANANPAELLAEIKKSVQSGKVKVPAGYEFTLEKVNGWIAEAKSKA